MIHRDRHLRTATKPQRSRPVALDRELAVAVRRVFARAPRRRGLVPLAAALLRVLIAGATAQPPRDPTPGEERVLVRARAWYRRYERGGAH